MRNYEQCILLSDSLGKEVVGQEMWEDVGMKDSLQEMTAATAGRMTGRVENKATMGCYC